MANRNHGKWLTPFHLNIEIITYTDKVVKKTKKMTKILRLKSRLSIIINFVFTLVFLVHAAFIGHGIKYPVQPSIKLYSKDVNELDSFPISFKICVKELENPSERYKKVGYSTVWNFFKGLPDSSGSLVGWSGNKTGNTRTTAEGTDFYHLTQKCQLRPFFRASVRCFL